MKSVEAMARTIRLASRSRASLCAGHHGKKALSQMIDVLGRLEGRSSLGRIRPPLCMARLGCSIPVGPAKRRSSLRSKFEPHAGGVVSGNANLFVYFRAALLALVDALPQQGRKQVLRADTAAG